MNYPRDTVQTIFASPLGDIRMAAHHNKLVGLWFIGQKYEHQPDSWRFEASHDVFTRALNWLEIFFKGLPLPIDAQNWQDEIAFPDATKFETLVWQQLLSIPLGQTVSYSELAQQLGKPTAYRAVAAAVGKNPISLIVPCHRVIGKNGDLTGYAGGLDRKKALLLLEQKSLKNTVIV